MCFAPCLSFAQTEGADALAPLLPASAVADLAARDGGLAPGALAPASAADTLDPAPADTLATEGSESRRITILRDVGFEADGIIPKRHAKAEAWDNIPLDCHIDWRRKRERPLIDFCFDLAKFFNTYDTTYVERNRYNFRVMALNTNYFQIYRIAGRDTESGQRQLLTFAPGRAVKVGARAGWRWLLLGYTYGVIPSTSRRASELNFAAYNSRIGCDMNWQHAGGPFRMRRATGIDGLPSYAVRGASIDGIKTDTYAFNLYYVFNYRHFSYPAAYNASTVQLRSAGSWLLGASYDLQRFLFDPDEAERVIREVCHEVNPSAPVPSLIDQLHVRSVNYHRIGVNVGYAYNWVPAPHWLVSASISPSLGFKRQIGENLSRDMLIDNFRNFHVDAIFRAGVVYNRQRWFVGASAVSYLYDYRHTNYDLNNNVTYIKAYVGVQFHKRRRFRLASDRTRW